jgi:hypothetical protein
MHSTERQKAAGRAHYWANHALRLVQMKQWRDAHREYRAAKMREWQATHREHREAYRQRNREKWLARAKERRRIYRLTHPRKVRMSDDERRARHRLYWQANRDRILARQRDRYHRNKEKEHLRGRLYRQRNRDALRERGRARYWRERDKNLEHARRYYQAHKAEHAAKQKLYRSNPVNRARRCERRRAAYRNTFGWHVRNVKRQQARKRAYQRQQAKLLTTAYVRKLLCRGTNLKPEDFPLAIVRVARAKLRLLRSVRSRRKKHTNA